MSAISIAISVFLALASPSFGSLLARDDVAAQNCNHDFAYTWDDGLSLWQVDIVDEFTCIGGKTTFFVHGNNQGSCIYSEDHVQSLRYAFESGHQIASNSWSNVDFSSLSQSQIDIEIQRLDEAIVKILGVKPRFFRAPQGQLSASTISYIESKHGKIVVSTDSDSGDIQGGASPEGNLAFYQNLAKQGKSKPHLSRSYATTVAGVDGLDFGSAETLINAGFKLISVAECLDTNAYEAVGSYGVRDSSWTCDGSWTSPATSTTCSQTYAAAADDKTCEKIGARFGVSGLAIYLANPYLNCGDIWAYTPVCIPTVAATLPTVCVQKYTAAKGDTCSKIAGLFGVTSEELFAANTFVNCNDIWQGTSFCIPKASNPTSCVSTYTASDGDTCKKIADKYGLNTAAIRNANTFVNCDDIWAHTPICIPGKTATNTATSTTTTTTATTTTTTSTSTTTSASAAPTCVSTYSAAKGDTCLKIANNFGLSEQAIKNANTFVNCADIWEWTPICIPPGGSTSTSTTTTASGSGGCVSTYQPEVVTTCQKVGQLFGLSEAAIRNANSFVNCNDIWAWTPLCIPSGGSASTSSSAATTTSTAAASCVTTYSAGDNESCSSVATKFGLTEKAVYDANTFVTCGSIWRYTPLCIPPGGRGCTKTIKSWPGATCETIASNYGATAENIQFWNSFVTCNNIWTDTDICTSH